MWPLVVDAGTEGERKLSDLVALIESLRSATPLGQKLSRLQQEEAQREKNEILHRLEWMEDRGLSEAPRWRPSTNCMEKNSRGPMDCRRESARGPGSTSRTLKKGKQQTLHRK
ncbi:unnamed protein product [Discosporangium mesarthrocarpum]